MESHLVCIFIVLVCSMQGVLCQTIKIKCSDNFQVNCSGRSLDTVADDVQEQTSVKIDIEVQKIYLDKTITFANLTSLIIRGKRSTTNIVCTTRDSNGSGIVVMNTSAVALTNLSLSFCGSLVQTDNKPNFYLSALTLLHCNVTATGLQIQNSNGIGMMIESHQGDNVSVRLSDFVENKLQHDSTYTFDFSKILYGGGGLHIFVHKSVPIPQRQTIVNINECTFVSNMANDTYPDEKSRGKVYRGRGGGAYVLLKSGLIDVHVTITKCTFTGNSAFHGGGLAVQVISDKKYEVANIQVEILQTTFEQNGCKNNTQKRSIPGAIGGGMHLTFDAYLDDSIIANSTYNIKDVNFTENCAELAGGLYHFSGRYSQAANSMALEKCVFERNVAHLGSAILMAPSSSRNLRSGNATLITFQGCIFAYNQVFHLSQKQNLPGIGTIYVSTYNIHFKQFNHFENNWGTALHIVNGIVHFEKSNMSFESNTGLQGGAIALIGSSAMIIGPQTYIFKNNRALFQGGAIYIQLIDKYDFNARSRNCFLQCVNRNQVFLHESCNANVSFEGNKVSHITHGHSIYSTSLHPCLVNNNNNGFSTPKKQNRTQMYRILDFTFHNGSFHNQIATDGSMFEIHTKKVTAISGKKFSHGVKVTNELYQTINAPFWATVKSTGEHKPNGSIAIDPSFASLITDKIQVRGSPNQSGTLTLNLASSSQSFIKLDMELRTCPPGFRYDNNSSECQCNAEAHTGIYKCDKNTFKSHLIPGYWAGYFDYQLVTSACPFCEPKIDKIIVLPHSKDDLDQTLCGNSREGFTCSKCKENFTVHFHSPRFKCKQIGVANCRLGWLLYILTELAPLTVTFIAVLILNISFTSGAINGFILFVQLVSSVDLNAGGIIPIQTDSGDFLDLATQGYQVIYGFFNLDFFNSELLSFCLWKRATPLDMIAFKYVTILYAMLLILTIVWIMNKCGGRWFGKCCHMTTVRSSIIHGISTFLMIGYAQCVNVSLRLLLQVHIYTAKYTKQHTFSRVWFNGEMGYFSKDHLPYALPAILSLATIGLLPPALLLIYPLVNKTIAYFGLEEHKLFSLVSKVTSMNSLKPLLDSFQGCFKDDLRFFAGIYFLYRWMILVIHLITLGFLSYYATVCGFLVVVLTVHTICQPYIKRIHNIIDALLLCNLVLINVLSLVNFHYSNNPVLPNRQIYPTAIAQLVLIYLPAVAMALYSGFVISKHCKNRTKSCTRKRRDLSQNQCTDSQRQSVNNSYIHERLIDEDTEFDSTHM